MKNILQKAGSRVGIAALVCAAAFFTVLAGCSSPLDHNEPAPAGMGTVLLTLDSPGLVRTTLPGDPPGGVAFDDYELTFAPQPSGAAINLSWDGAASLFVPVGDYILSVLAFAGTGDDREQVAQGTSEQFTVSEHGPNAVSVLLFPVGGAGTFEWNLTVPDGITAAGLQVFVYTADGAAETAYWTSEPLAPVGNTIAGERGLPANRYLAVFTLTRGAETATIAEIVHVFRDRTSLFTETVTDIRFPSSLLAFIAGAWNGTDFGDSGVTHAHFAPPRGLAVQGVTSGNFDNLVEQFAYLLEEYFPTTIYGVRALIDAALIADNTGPAFAIAEDFATRAEAESEIADFAPNTPDALYFTWNPDAGDEVEAGDTVTVRVGDADGYSFEVMITFIDDTRTPVASVVIYGNYAAPIDIFAAPVTLQLSAVAYDTGGADISDEWVFAWRATSIPEGAITVDNNGLVTAHFAGEDGTATATIIAATGNLAVDSSGITVTARQRATGITIAPAEDVTVVHEETRTLTATVIPANAIVEDKTVVWTIEDTGISIVGEATGATVTVRGDALDAVATVVATIDGTAVSAEVEVRVVAPPAFELIRRRDPLGTNTDHHGRLYTVMYNNGDLALTGRGRITTGSNMGAGTVYTEISGDFIAEVQLVSHVLEVGAVDSNHNLAGLWLITDPGVNVNQYAITWVGRTERPGDNNARDLRYGSRTVGNGATNNDREQPHVIAAPGTTTRFLEPSPTNPWNITFERRGAEFILTVEAVDNNAANRPSRATTTLPVNASFASTTETYWLGLFVGGDGGNNTAVFRNFYITQNGTRSRVNLNQPDILDIVPPVATVAIDGGDEVVVERSITLNANVTPSNAYQNVTWIVEQNYNGTGGEVSFNAGPSPSVSITGVAEGRVRVRARSDAGEGGQAIYSDWHEVEVVEGMAWTRSFWSFNYVNALTPWQNLNVTGNPATNSDPPGGTSTSITVSSPYSAGITLTAHSVGGIRWSTASTRPWAPALEGPAAVGVLQVQGSHAAERFVTSAVEGPFMVRIRYGASGSTEAGRFVRIGFGAIETTNDATTVTTHAGTTIGPVNENQLGIAERSFLGTGPTTVHISADTAVRYFDIEIVRLPAP